MKETLIKLFKPNAKTLSPNEIKESLRYKQITNIQLKGIEKIYNQYNQHLASYTLKELMWITKSDKDTLINTLKELEEEEILYYQADEDKYKAMPNNYFITTCEVSKKGNYKISHNGINYNLSYQNTNGILPFDKILLKKEGEDINLVKIIKRANPEVVCEVLENGKIKLVGNDNIKVRCVENNFKKLKLTPGTRFLAKISEEEFNNIYDVSYLCILGNKNDLNAELEAITYNNGFKVRYTEEETNEVYSLPTEVTKEEKTGRVDLTNERIFTIDGESTKDMDDAVSIRKLPNGNYELMVSIAHVSHYIKYEGPLFNRAKYNTTSVYLIDAVNHMLHPQVSNGICSLNPNVERLAKTYKIEINQKGKIVDFTFFDSVIKSKKKMSYEKCNEIFDKNKIVEDYEEYKEDLLLMQELAQIIENSRKANGALDFGNSEINFILDEKGSIKDVVKKSHGTAEKIIENFMVITNEGIAQYMYNLGIEFIYRNHEIPFDDKIKETIKLIKTMGYKINALSNNSNPHVIQNIINTLNTKEEFFILSSLLLRSMQKAYFSTENKGHYGLALESYSQITSPIRRLMDLMIEYILDNIQNIYNGLVDMEKLKSTLNELCQRASMMERCADKAEYEANKLYMINYVINHKDTIFDGYIQEITPKYLVVKTKELIEGIVYLEDIADGFYRYSPECKWVENTLTKHRIMIGNKISLKFKDANKEFRILKFNGKVNTPTLKRKK